MSKETRIANLNNIVALENLSTTQEDDNTMFTTILFHTKAFKSYFLLNYSSGTCMADTNTILAPVIYHSFFIATELPIVTFMYV